MLSPSGPPPPDASLGFPKVYGLQAQARRMTGIADCTPPLPMKRRLAWGGACNRLCSKLSQRPRRCCATTRAALDLGPSAGGAGVTLHPLSALAHIFTIAPTEQLPNSHACASTALGRANVASLRCCDMRCPRRLCLGEATIAATPMRMHALRSAAMVGSARCCCGLRAAMCKMPRPLLVRCMCVASTPLHAVRCDICTPCQCSAVHQCTLAATMKQHKQPNAFPPECQLKMKVQRDRQMPVFACTSPLPRGNDEHAWRVAASCVCFPSRHHTPRAA